jgi:hypothetical protein
MLAPAWTESPARIERLQRQVLLAALEGKLFVWVRGWRRHIYEDDGADLERTIVSSSD